MTSWSQTCFVLCVTYIRRHAFATPLDWWSKITKKNKKKKKERVSGVEEREKFLKSDQKIWVSVYP